MPCGCNQMGERLLHTLSSPGYIVLIENLYVFSEVVPMTELGLPLKE